ncbi:MAG: hypothetical protein WBW37_16520, partial [Methyloceanibacter sp.]
LAPLLLNLAAKLLPISFDTIPVHGVTPFAWDGQPWAGGKSKVCVDPTPPIKIEFPVWAREAANGLDHGARNLKT